jgi:hypothetical protein
VRCALPGSRAAGVRRRRRSDGLIFAGCHETMQIIHQMDDLQCYRDEGSLTSTSPWAEARWSD